MNINDTVIINLKDKLEKIFSLVDKIIADAKENGLDLKYPFTQDLQSVQKATEDYIKSRIF